MIELLVVLVILGVMAGVVGAALRLGTQDEPPPDAASSISAARATALRTGRMVAVTIHVDGYAYAVAAWPDGSVHADSALRADVLTGRVLDAR